MGAGDSAAIEVHGNHVMGEKIADVAVFSNLPVSTPGGDDKSDVLD